MIAFWIAAAVLSAAAAALMLAMGARAAAPAGEDPALALHRRQLSEIDELAERGLLADAERDAARAEAGRRMLGAADHQDVQGAGGRRLALVAAALTPIAAVAVYLFVGSPQMADQPFGKRLAEWRAGDPAKLDPPQMAAVLRMIAAERPRDPEPLRNLALAELASDNPAGAVDALRKALTISPRRADLWAMLGEVFVMQTGGEVGGDARAAFGEALRIDPTSQGARYFVARGDIAAGRVAEGLAVWKTLLDELPAGDPRAQSLGAEIASVESAGGLKPVQEQPAEMEGAIRGMVDGLAAKLAANPDDPEGWVRLVRAYTVLGETEKRDAALARARALFKTDADVLAALDEAAK
jgi:cytochrome c-type biogenesis protein CcmH